MDQSSGRPVGEVLLHEHDADNASVNLRVLAVVSHEGVRREAPRTPHGWVDAHLMALPERERVPGGGDHPPAR